MPLDPQLAERVAREVLGWERTQAAGGPAWRDQDGHLRVLPNDTALVGLVARAMNARGYRFHLSMFEDGQVLAGFYPSGGTAEERADTPDEAAARAALAVLEHEQ